MEDKVKIIYNKSIKNSSKYSLSVMLVLGVLLILYFVDNTYITNTILSINVIYAFDKFLKNRVTVETDTSKLVGYNNIKEFILYYVFIIFISIMVLLMSFIIDLYILKDNIIQLTQITILFFGSYSTTKFINRY